MVRSPRHSLRLYLTRCKCTQGEMATHISLSTKQQQTCNHLSVVGGIHRSLDSERGVMCSDRIHIGDWAKLTSASSRNLTQEVLLQSPCRPPVFRPLPMTGKQSKGKHTNNSFPSVKRLTERVRGSLPNDDSKSNYTHKL